ncbi:(2Fe-2S)-binding protein [Pigmentiphaga soli]|uniref:(2Fe-2S)-binding protein n=1 Tax=Pigmentiphaga soli TaxID=1007095 RepID=A0ABP8GU05_9BURK
MFRPLPDSPARPLVNMTIDGSALAVAADISVAAALLAAGDEATRTTPVSGAPRMPYCLMGACFDCLVEIDGVPNQQACLVQVREGMRICRAMGARTVSP